MGDEDLSKLGGDVVDEGASGGCGEATEEEDEAEDDVDREDDEDVAQVVGDGVADEEMDDRADEDVQNPEGGEVVDQEAIAGDFGMVFHRRHGGLRFDYLRYLTEALLLAKV